MESGELSNHRLTEEEEQTIGNLLDGIGTHLYNYNIPTVLAQEISADIAAISLIWYRAGKRYERNKSNPSKE